MHFERWMRKKGGGNDRREPKDFVLGAHKAAAIAMVMQKAAIFLISFWRRTVRKIGLTPFTNVQEAMEAAFARLGNAPGACDDAGGSTRRTIWLAAPTQEQVLLSHNLMKRIDCRKKMEKYHIRKKLELFLSIESETNTTSCFYFLLFI